MFRNHKCKRPILFNLINIPFPRYGLESINIEIEKPKQVYIMNLDYSQINKYGYKEDCKQPHFLVYVLNSEPISCNDEQHYVVGSF